MTSLLRLTSSSLLLQSLLLALLACRVQAQPQWVIVDPPGQDGVELSSGMTGAEELSGITWAGGSQFYVVGDNFRVVYPLSLSVDAHSGLVSAAALGSGVTLATGSDLEGIAFNPSNASWLVSDESSAAIREYAVADGSLLQTLPVPAVFAGVRPNLSLESLSRQADGAALWTANEEALSSDGPVSSFASGSTVRLQKFDATLQAVGQWAYVTDPLTGDILTPGRDVEASGVSDLVALPGGQLLVLERAFGLGLFRHRLYEVDFAGATDVSALPSLDGVPHTAVTKHLLWERTGASNFEGISLGPALPNQGQSLLLVSDNGNGLSQQLYALALLPNVPMCSEQPLMSCRPAGGSRVAISSSGGERDKLRWSWRKGTLPDLVGFGDPTTAIGHGLALCVYDATVGLSALRIATGIGLGAGWVVGDGTKLAYADRSRTASGITKLKARVGLGRGELRLSGKGGGLGLPPPLPSGTLLDRDPQVTVQLVNRDNTSECFEAAFAAASKETNAQFKAGF